MDPVSPVQARDDAGEGLLAGHMVDVSSPDSSKAPKDRNYLVYLIFFLMGAGTLLPWNVFITAAPYFKVRFRGTVFEQNFESFFGVGFNITNVIGLYLLTKYQNRIQPRRRVVLPFILNALVFVITTALVLVPPEQLGGNAVFAITILCTLISGGVVAVVQGGVFGLAAQFPAVYTQAVMGGQGLAGIIASLMGMITVGAAAPLPDGQEQTYAHLRWSSFAYFLIACSVVVACIFGYLCLERLPFALHHAPETLTPRTRRVIKDFGPSGGSPASIEDGGDATDADRAFVRGRISHLYWAVFNIFFVTLALFPAITADVGSTTAQHGSSARFFNDLWVPFSFLLFNVCDFAGRSLAGFNARLLGDVRSLATVAWLRWVFFPFFMLSNVNNSALPQVFTSDAWPIVFMIVFATTNGYISTCLLMEAPKLVPAKFAELAGTYMVFLLLCGLGAGSLVSFAVHAIVCRCNPFQ